MKMDAVHVNNVKCCMDEEEPNEKSFPPENSDVDHDIFGETEIFPRVGEQYQVEIPPILTGLDYSLSPKSLQGAEIRGDIYDFVFGLPIPVMWINRKVMNIKHKAQESACDFNNIPTKTELSKSECIKETQNSSEGSQINAKVELVHGTLVNKKRLVESENFHMQQDSTVEVHKMDRGENQYLVPESSSGSWDDIEEASFLLGLYIFGKDLVQVKRFVGDKNMGDILSLYYGRFYRSERYLRWYELRKMRSRKCIYGQKIFTGARLQEILSRLLLDVPEEQHTTLQEVTKAFSEGKMLLEEYVLNLKASVGLTALVEAVGIGKGKQDLTGITMDPLKSARTFLVRPEIPVGKACSSLTPLEIVNFLRGDFRLSKARSNDLFWEAVWPRLLARGWHSEEPKSCGYASSSKHSLVFLVPGVKKFSKTRLVKGDHYFDSVSDVLSKVASDPGLLEFENGSDNSHPSKEDKGLTAEAKLDQDNFRDQQRHCYLKPRVPSCSKDTIKFTVVDTSIAGGKTSKLRELRSLPIAVVQASTSESDSEDDASTSEEQTNESDSVNTVCSNEDKRVFLEATKISVDGGLYPKMYDLEYSASQTGLPVGVPYSANLNNSVSKDQKTELFECIHSRNDLKRQSSKSMVPNSKNPTGPVTKQRRRFIACNHAALNCSTENVFIDLRLKHEESGCFLDCTSAEKDAMSQKDPFHENKSSSDCSSKASLVISSNTIPSTHHLDIEDEHENPQTQMLIDLNLPISPNIEADEPLTSEMTEKHDSMTKEPYDPSEERNSKSVDNSAVHSNVTTRRQSTRNGPPTTKVLEAFAFGFLDKKEKRKGGDTSRGDCIKSIPSKRARLKVTCETFGNGEVDLQMDKRANGLCNGNVNVMSPSFKFE